MKATPHVAFMQPSPYLMDRLMDLLAQMLPGDALSLVQDHVRELISGTRGGLLSFGLLAALWTSSSAMTAIMESLNRAYDVEERRPFWKVRSLVILRAIEDGGNGHSLPRHSGGVDPRGNRIGIAVSAPLTTCCGSHSLDARLAIEHPSWPTIR